MVAGAASKVTLPFLVLGKGCRARPSAQRAFPLQQPRLLKRTMKRWRAGHKRDRCYRSSHRKLCYLLFLWFMESFTNSILHPTCAAMSLRDLVGRDKLHFARILHNTLRDTVPPASHPKPPHGQGLLFRKATHHIPPVLGLKSDQPTGGSSPDWGSSGVQQPH